MKQLRSGETKHYPFRSERFYHANNGWYFLVRGGTAQGPFPQREAAESALKRYMETQQQMSRAFSQRREPSF